MSSDRSGSAPISGTTSASRRINPAELSEQQFLQHQQDLARQAISRTWGQITAGIGQGANPVEWAREYPWTALGAAAVAGFVAASSLIPSKRQQALNRLAELERALHPLAHMPPVDEGAPPSRSDKPSSKRSVLAGFLLEAIKTLQPVLISAITAKASSGSKNGHDSAAAAADRAVDSDATGGSDSPA